MRIRIRNTAKARHIFRSPQFKCKRGATLAKGGSLIYSCLKNSDTSALFKFRFSKHSIVEKNEFKLVLLFCHLSDLKGTLLYIALLCCFCDWFQLRMRLAKFNNAVNWTYFFSTRSDPVLGLIPQQHTPHRYVDPYPVYLPHNDTSSRDGHLVWRIIGNKGDLDIFVWKIFLFQGTYIYFDYEKWGQRKKVPVFSESPII